MLDFNSPTGKKIKNRLCQELTIWLTTVDAKNTPQPRPVWFHWDGETVMIWSQVKGAKVRHIQNNPRVALNFNTDADGGEVAVMIGEAHFAEAPPAPERMEAYLEKYKKSLEDLGMTEAGLEADYPVIIYVIPEAMRGF